MGADATSRLVGIVMAAVGGLAALYVIAWIADEIILWRKRSSVKMKTFLDVVYDPAYPTGKLDLYKPGGAANGRPLVVYVHGGDWEYGDKSALSSDPYLTTFNALVAAGYWVASVNYRLAPAYLFPAMIQDVKSAIRWLKNHAGTYGFDPTRIAVWGSSAGGHLAACAGQSGTPVAWEAGGNPGPDSSVKAVVDWYGSVNPDTMSPPATNPTVFTTVFGQPPYTAVAATTYVSATSKPTLLQHGASDGGVPPSQSQEFYDDLVAAGVYAQLVLVQNAGHQFAPSPPGSTINPSLPQIAGQVVSFLQGHL